MEHGLVTDIAICIIAAWIVAVLAQVVRQPLLLAYLVAGFAIGPHGFKRITDVQNITTISEIGLSLLLFMIGLEIDLKKMLSAGKVITLTAAVQILGCFFLGWLVFDLCGPAQNRLEALYLAVAAAMSSTIIIVKILYDKRELETLAGRITLGVLVLQDIATILFLAIQPNLKNPAVGLLLLAFSKVILLVAVAYVVSKFVLPPVFKMVARLPELVLVGALAWCFAMAGFAGWLGLSTAMGALIAGVMISTFPYTLDVAAKVTSLRDFFVTRRIRACPSGSLPANFIRRITLRPACSGRDMPATFSPCCLFASVLRWRRTSQGSQIISKIHGRPTRACRTTR